jgi:hypothetical protein
MAWTFTGYFFPFKVWTISTILSNLQSPQTRIRTRLQRREKNITARPSHFDFFVGGGSNLTAKGRSFIENTSGLVVGKA